MSGSSFLNSYYKAKEQKNTIIIRFKTYYETFCNACNLENIK